MSASRSATWILAANRRRAGYADLRISDAERAEVADLLSMHYGDGRLDQAEFNQRLDQAMAAKTYRDLTGLFADLPPTEAAGGSDGPGSGTGSEVAGRLRPQRRGHPFLILVAVVAIALILGHALTVAWAPWAWPFNPLTWIAIIVAIVLIAGRRRKSP